MYRKLMKYWLMEEAGDGSGGGEGGGASEGQGALGGGDLGAGAEGGTEVVEIDYDKMSDEEYASKINGGEGFDKASFQKNYAQFCRENKIPVEAVEKYIGIERGLVEARQKEIAAEEAKDLEAFNAEGEQLKKDFNGEQIKSAISALKSFNGDEKFMSFATGKLSNNASLVKLLCCWADAHKEDTLPNAGGAGSGAEKNFAQRWIG